MIWLDTNDEEADFPDVECALREPDGLLAIGGTLTVQRILQAYRKGIFPWYNDGQPILWWSPDPRTVLFPGDVKISRSLRKILRNQQFQVSMDCAFEAVIAGCAAPRKGQEGTWITREMNEAYIRLHELGICHSVEVRSEGKLVGGLYGLGVGGMFFGESMFSLQANASKVALIHLDAQLAMWNFKAIDCQTRTEHLIRLGARELPRSVFTEILRGALEQTDRRGRWQLDPSVLEYLRNPD